MAMADVSHAIGSPLPSIEHYVNEADGNSLHDRETHDGLEDAPLFTCWSRLPIELRFKIWKLSCTQRIIEVFLFEYTVFRKDPEDFRHGRDQDGRLVYGPLRSFQKQMWWSRSETQPVISRVCHESRKMFLEEYSLSKISHPADERVTWTYINPRVDILFYSNRAGNWYHESKKDPKSFYTHQIETFCETLNPKLDKAQIRHFGISVAEIWSWISVPSRMEFLSILPGLQELVLVLQEDPDEKASTGHSVYSSPFSSPFDDEDVHWYSYYDDEEVYTNYPQHNDEEFLPKCPGFLNKWKTLPMLEAAPGNLPSKIEDLKTVLGMKGKEAMDFARPSPNSEGILVSSLYKYGEAIRRIWQNSANSPEPALTALTNMLERA